MEGAFAAFLFDVAARPGISDPYGGNELALHYPGHFVANMLVFCYLQPSFNPERTPDGTDDVAYCLENLVDPSVTSTYFQTRVSFYTPESLRFNNDPGFPVNWSQPDVRRVWLHKLYGQ